jgi:hypothetical protein
MVPAEVSVDVAMFHTSEASVPNVVSDRVPDDHTLSGIVAANEVEAVRTVAFVFASIVEMALVICVFVFAFMFAARDVDADAIALLVLLFTEVLPVEIANARPLEAFVTAVFVFELTAVVPAEMAAAREVEALETIVFVFPFILDANDVEAVPTVLAVFEFIFELSDEEAFPTIVFVFALTAVVPAEIAEASEVEADVTSDWSASEPDESPAPVSVREPKLQT